MDIVAVDRPTCSSAPRRPRARSSGSSCAAAREGPAALPRCASRGPASEPRRRSASGRSATERRPVSRSACGRSAPPAAGDLLDAEVVVEDGQETPPAVPGHRRRARLADVHDLALPLRPGLVEHAGGLHRDVGRGDPVPIPVPGARPGARQGAPRDGPPRPGLQVRPRRARLPQAVLGRLPGGPGLRPPAPGRRAARVRRRDLQRAEHEPDERGIDHPQRDLRRRLPARRARRRAGDGVAARRVRPRPAVPGDHGRRRRDLELVGARPVPRMGSQLGPRARAGWAFAELAAGEPPADAVPDRVRLDRAERAGAADELHGRPLLGRLVDGRRADARGGRGARSIACSPSSRTMAATQERHAAGRHRLLAARTSGSARSSATGTAATSGRSSRPPSRASSSTRSARRRPPRAVRSPRRPGT